MPGNNPTRVKIILIVCGFLLSLVLLEIGIRAGGLILLTIQEYRNAQAIKQKGACRIMCLGESTTAGQYPKPLEKILNARSAGVKFSVIDEGVIAANTNTILAKLETNLDKYKPDIVITMMGYNDKWIMYYQDIPEASSGLFQNYRTYRLIRLIYAHSFRKPKKKALSDQGVARARPEGKFRPRDGQNYGELGYKYQRQGDLDLAAKYFKKSLELNPKDDEILLNWGELLRNQDRSPEAERYFKKAIKINPKNCKAYIGLGCIYRKQGELGLAEKYYQKALEVDPAEEWACSELLQVYKMQGRSSQREKILQWFIEQNPKNDWGYKTLEGFYRETGEVELAETYNSKLKGLNLKEYSSLTMHNYRMIKQILDKRGIKLVCVQYPLRSVEPLKRIFASEGGAIFVDNEKVFEEAIEKYGYKKYFADMFGGDFGHCTQEGNRLLAANIADVILKEIFSKSHYYSIVNN
jgi:Flp pilus assembly protein TadD